MYGAHIPRLGDAYDRRVGRCGAQLASELIAFAGIDPMTRLLDVGCRHLAR